MEANKNSTEKGQGSNDKIHPSDLGETQDFNELSFNKDKNSFELDVKGKDKDYDHPLPYETTAENGGDDNSDYDEANPYIGDEYASKQDQQESDLETLGMHVDKGEIVELNPEDEFLARTPEDDRDDLDEEGYPINDAEPLK
ncbi:hypothetical protein [Pedobacter antarcticus]|uniref:Uncharacterized protein n=2 Tax=Pedobacter antarcticus TaxID=34086 RepID=A0A081PCX0_9SPHI|nr:hypothetical protein [Pedobacter antarcticus]KEQ28543.1 hypothetical protein N180_20765 [Pedobacter antarcticus 4BY]SDM05437.1 hypothetical protein SAMN04488084_103422 [Pedobacter antarcticus]SFF47068.1 hypothetical protein SAMN03003324_04072 [Pedobacter antarcticus]